MVAQAISLGLQGIGIADRNTVAGVVRAHVALRKAREQAKEDGLPDFDFRLVTGARLAFADGTPDIIPSPDTSFVCGRITRLLATGNPRPKKCACSLHMMYLLVH